MLPYPATRGLRKDAYWLAVLATTMRLPVASLVTLVWLGSHVLVVQPVLACRCTKPTVDDAYTRADAVFEAKVLAISDGPTGLPLPHEAEKSIDDPWDYLAYLERMHGLRVELSVARSWKGDIGQKVVILTGRGGGDCGYPFEQERDYIVFAYRAKDGFLRTHICDRTSEKVHAREELEHLKKLEPVVPGD